MKEGDLTIVDTGQAGTVVQVSGTTIQVLLRSGEIWAGEVSRCREPQSPEDLAVAPIEVPRLEPKRKRR